MNRKLKCLLLDDELPGLTYLKLLCEQIPELEIVKAFNDPEVFITELPTLEFDLCILDIEMPFINGLQVANLLGGKLIIFTTAYKEYAAEAFDLDAVDYVGKPLQKERLELAVKKAIKRLDSSQPSKAFIQLNTDKGKALLFFEQLCFIRTSNIDSRDKIAYLKDGNMISLKNVSFSKLLELLPNDQFCQINKKELISLSIVKWFTFDEITTNYFLNSDKVLVLTLGEPYRNNFIKSVEI